MSTPQDDTDREDTALEQPIGSIQNMGDEWQGAPEQSLLQASQAAESAGKALLVKTGLHLYDVSKQSYIGWRGQAWKVTLKDADAARQLRDALAAFFRALAVLGPERMIAVLVEAAKAAA